MIHDGLHNEFHDELHNGFLIITMGFRMSFELRNRFYDNFTINFELWNEFHENKLRLKKLSRTIQHHEFEKK